MEKLTQCTISGCFVVSFGHGHASAQAGLARCLQVWILVRLPSTLLHACTLHDAELHNSSHLDHRCCKHVQVDENEVNRLHKAFYAKVAELFEAHRKSFKGYENVKLVMIE